MAALIAVSVLLPLAGTAAALVLLVALRSADLTSTWRAGRRSRSGRPGGVAAAVAYAPVAVVRSALNLVVKLPLALLFAAIAAAISLVAAPSATRAAAWAAGAVVACYSLGPGSARCRRPVSKFFGAVTGSTPSAVVVFVGMTALAAAAVAAAISLPPYIVPAIHLSDWAQHLPVIRQVVRLPADFRVWRVRLSPLSRWLG